MINDALIGLVILRPSKKNNILITTPNKSQIKRYNKSFKYLPFSFFSFGSDIEIKLTIFLASSNKSESESGANGFVAIKTLEKPFSGTVLGLDINLAAGTKILLKYQISR